MDVPEEHRPEIAGTNPLERVSDARGIGDCKVCDRRRRPAGRQAPGGSGRPP